MRSRSARISSLVLASLGLWPTEASAAAWDKPGYTLTFHDEFDAGSLDTTAWKRRYKWGEAVINNELQAYVDDAFSVSNGRLSISGKHVSGAYAGQTLDYTSGVICSVHEQKYGYFEARLKMPKGKGLWPAFWLLGAVGTQGVNEIDIHELLGHEPNKVYMTVHWGPSYDQGHESDGSEFTGPDFSADFHTFGLSWTSSQIVWTVDGVERKTYSGPGVPNVDMYVILNLAIGGNWPGAPDASTAFPATYEVDYVRTYQPLAGDAGVGGAGGSGTGGAAGAGGAATGGASAGGTSGSGGQSGGGGMPQAGTGGASGGGSTDDSGGCGCRAGASERSAASASLLLLTSLATSRLVRRRRRPENSRSLGRGRRPR